MHIIENEIKILDEKTPPQFSQNNQTYIQEFELLPLKMDKAEETTKITGVDLCYALATTEYIPPQFAKNGIFDYDLDVWVFESLELAEATKASAGLKKAKINKLPSNAFFQQKFGSADAKEASKLMSQGALIRKLANIKENPKIKSIKTNVETETEEDAPEEKELLKAKATARRKAILQGSQYEIAKSIQKQYPSLRGRDEEIASKALSWAEGQQTGCEVTVGGIPKKITDMASLDAQFAQLEAPGQPCVTIHRSDAQPISNNDFNKRLSGQVVLSGVDDQGRPKYIAASSFWSGNAHKYVYKKIVFTNKPVGNDTYNLFTGFGIVPENGQCEKILAHIKDVICAGNEANNTAFIKLLAWQMQNIGSPSRIIVALKSKIQQVGKGCLLADILAVIYGNSGFVTSDLGQIITRFNDTIRGKAFIFLDEALFSGDRKSADAVKSLATTTRMGVESKGIPTVQFPIGVNLFLATNHDDAAHVEEADARYWILEASPHQAGNTKYFQDLYAEINNGGREAFMHYLLTLNISNFIPSRDVPKDNESKDAMIRNSINPYDARKWLEACCDARMVLGLKPRNPDLQFPWEPWETGEKYENGFLSTAYTEWQKGIKSPVAPKPTAPNKFGELLNKSGFELRIQASCRYRILPDSDECLKTIIGMIEKSEK